MVRHGIIDAGVHNVDILDVAIPRNDDLADACGRHCCVWGGVRLYAVEIGCMSACWWIEGVLDSTIVAVC